MLYGAPPPWNDGPVTLYHGTLESAVPSLTRGIDLRHARPFRDFGRGFYTTTLQRQAASWAVRLAKDSREPDKPIVVAFEITRADLVSLDVLAFVRGDYEAEDYWSLVWRCRPSDADHGRIANGGWYDVVVGPVTAFWDQRLVLDNAHDQISFHTRRAVALLNRTSIREVPWRTI